MTDAKKLAKLYAIATEQCQPLFPAAQVTLLPPVGAAEEGALILTDAETRITVYDSARQIMVQPLFAPPPISPAPIAGNVTGIVAELDAIITSAAALRDRVAALSAPAPITMPVRAYRNVVDRNRRLKHSIRIKLLTAIWPVSPP